VSRRDAGKLGRGARRGPCRPAPGPGRRGGCASLSEWGLEGLVEEAERLAAIRDEAEERAKATLAGA
jgi:hypothetical protein